MSFAALLEHDEAGDRWWQSRAREGRSKPRERTDSFGAMPIGFRLRTPR
jgi:hypothetical protein